MTDAPDFTIALEAKVAEQLQAQRVGYLLGAGASHIDGNGYPLAFELWDLIKCRISDTQKRDEIQAKLDDGAAGIEEALDLLDDGGAKDTPYRHLVTAAIAELFRPKEPALDLHVEFIRKLSQRAEPYVKIFCLNYDPLLERAAEEAEVRVSDGFIGHEHAYFDSAVFNERVGQIRGTHKGRQFNETVKPIHLFKLHGSLGWYECPQRGVRRCAFGSTTPNGTKRLMVPPQHRKAADTMLPPYSALWSAFRGSLIHDAKPVNRLACIGYGFGDEHVNVVIEAALARSDFTLLIFTKTLRDTAWNRWSIRTNAVVVTKTRCSLKGVIGPGHPDLWQFERLCMEV
ncbi:MAG: SIR2 family protein [Candidatus Poribacteria bacterium]|nr:SIR2 family protein [Candidatus Poribacteria bacterium]